MSKTRILTLGAPLLGAALIGVLAAMALVSSGFTSSMLGLALSDRPEASENRSRDPRIVQSVSGLEVFRLADQINLRDLDNGHFLFRLAREKRTGVVYWAYMGMTRDVIAMVPDAVSASLDDGTARKIMLRVADLPTRVGCGVGQIHRSKVFIVPEAVKFAESEFTPEATPLFAVGEVRNDTSGRTPTRLMSYKNFLIGKHSVR